MSIDVHAKNVKLWKNEREGSRGTFYTYSISISKKMKDGTYKNKGIKLITGRYVVIPQEVPTGALCDIEGFMTLDVYEGRDGEVSNPAIFATKIMFKDYEANDEYADVDSYEQLDEDVPF